MNPNDNSKKPTGGPSRRDFVKQSSVIMVGSALAGLGTAAKVALAAEAAGDGQLKIALIGCGGRGTEAAVQALSTKGKVTLWAMADAFERNVEQSLSKIERTLEQRLGEGSADTIAEKVQVPEERRFAGLDAYQQAIDSGVDVVLMASPPGFRPQQFEAAIEAGKHVFMEKPLAVDAPGIRRVLKAGKLADEKGLKVGVGLQRHHDPSYVETVSRLQDGAIGKIHLTRVYWNGGGLWVRNRANFYRAHGHEPTEMEYQVNNWYYFNWLCGDHIVEQHIHNIDVSNWVKGEHPIEAKGMGGRELRRGKDFGQIYDHHFVEFTYPDGTTMMSQCRHMDGCWTQVAEYADGGKGTANISGGRINTPTGEWRYSGERVNPYQQEHDELFAAIREGKPMNETEYGAESTMTAIMGRMATYSGQVITWDQAINSQIDLSPSEYDFASTPPAVPAEDGSYPVPSPGKTVVV